MKKILFLTSLMISLAILTLSCSSDDDSSSPNCTTCTTSVFNITASTEYCDNRDGTVTATTDGESETIDLEGGSFNAFIGRVGLLADCN
ncbi:MAG: hypothetical protein AAGC43_14250 [Bacteroidota bacterium]